MENYIFAFFTRAGGETGSVMDSSSDDEWRRNLIQSCSVPDAQVSLFRQGWLPAELEADSATKLEGNYARIVPVIEKLLREKGVPDQELVGLSRKIQVSRNEITGLVVFVFLYSVGTAAEPAPATTGLQPRAFGQLFMAYTPFVGLILLPMLILGAIFAFSMDQAMLFWAGCLPGAITMLVVFSAVFGALNIETSRDFVYAEFGADRVSFRKWLTDWMLKRQRYSIISPSENEIHFKYRMAAPLRVRFFNDRAQMVGPQSLINALFGSAKQAFLNPTPGRRLGGLR